MIIPEIHNNMLGGYWVNLIDVTADGQKIVGSRSFDTLKEANEFWATEMKAAMQEVKK